MAVVVVAVGGVAVAVVDVIHVVAVLNRFMSAVWAVDMVMIRVDDVLAGFALVPVSIVFAVEVAVVDVVHVVVVLDSFVSAVWAVDVVMVGMGDASGGHGGTPSGSYWKLIETLRRVWLIFNRLSIVGLLKTL
ncbi:Uncharacterised protein [Corynebacterium cystitidis]|nr:Uncharacterised protein [Corynebacterium cystitidis]